MAIRLRGSVEIVGTQRVLASLFEHQLEFEFIPHVDLKVTEDATADFLSISPFGEIPIFQDGDMTLFESRAAMRYISHEYATRSIQQIYGEPLLQGVVATWIDVETHHFQPPALKLIAQLIDKPRSGQRVDKEVVADEEKRLVRVLDVYEERLTKSKFLGGDEFSAADFTHTPYLQRLMATDIGRAFKSRPHVSAWCATLLARPAWAKVMEMVNSSSIAKHD